jgi:hypothetical protein
MHGEINEPKIVTGKYKRRDHMSGISTNGSITLKCTFSKEYFNL